MEALSLSTIFWETSVLWEWSGGRSKCADWSAKEERRAEVQGHFIPTEAIRTETREARGQRCWYKLLDYGASLMSQTVKNLPAIQETWVQSLGREDPLEKEMATHSSIFAWRIPWTEEPDGLEYMRSQRVRNNWSALTCTYACPEFVSMDLEHLELFWWPQLALRDPPCSYQSSPFWSFTLELWHSGPVLFSVVAACNTCTMNHLSYSQK